MPRPILTGLIFLFIVLTLPGCASRTPVPTAPPPQLTTSSTTPRPTPTVAIQGTQITATPAPTDAPFSTQHIGALGKGFITHTATSPDGQIVVIGYGDGHIEWLDTTSGQVIGSLQLKQDYDFRLQNVLFHAEAHLFILIEWDSFQVVDRDTNRVIASAVANSNAGLDSVVISHNGEYLVYRENHEDTGGAASYITTFSISENKPLTELIVPNRGEYLDVSAPAISPDGQWVSAGSSDNRVFVWSLQTGELQHELSGHADDVNSVAFQPDGAILASSGYDGTVRLWDTNQWNLARVVTGFLAGINTIQFEDRRHLTVYYSGLKPQTLDLDTNTFQDKQISYPAIHPQVLKKYFEGYTHSDFGDARPIFNPKGRTVALVSDIVQIIDLQSGRVEAVIAGNEGQWISGAVFSPDGHALAVAFQDGSIGIWNADNGTHLRDVRPPTGLIRNTIYHMVFSPDGQRLAINFGDTVEVWDVTVVKQIDQFHISTLDRYANKLTFSADSQRLFALMHDDKILLCWDVVSGQVVRREEMPNGYETWGAGRDSNWHWPLFARFFDDADGPKVEIRNVETGESRKLEVTDYGGHLEFSADGTLLLAATQDSQLFIWKVRTGELAYVADNISSYDSPTLSPDLHVFAINQNDQVELWDFQPILQKINAANFSPLPLPTSRYDAGPKITATPTPIQTITALPKTSPSPQKTAQLSEIAHFGSGTIDWVNWLDDGSRVIAAGSQGVFTYDPFIPANLPRLSWVSTADLANGLKLLSVAQNDQHHLIAAGILGNQIQVWDVTDQKQLMAKEGSGVPALSSNGRQVVYQDGKGELNVYDLKANKQIAQMITYQDKPVWSPDGRWVAVGRTNNYIRIWDAKTGTIANALSAKGHLIQNFTFSPDGNHLAAIVCQSILVWENVPGAEPREYQLFPQSQQSSEPQTECLAPTALTFAPDGLSLAVGTTDGIIQLISPKTGQVLRQIGKMSGSIQFLAFHAEGSSLLAVTTSGQMGVWTLAHSGSVEQVVPAEHTSPIQGLIFDQQGQLYAWDRSSIWAIQPQTGRLLSTTHIPGGTIYAVSPTGTMAAVYSGLHIELWRIPDGSRQQIIEDVPGIFYTRWSEVKEFHAAVFSRDGKMLAVAGSGGIWIEETNTGKQINQVQGENPGWVSFSSDGQQFVTEIDPYNWLVGVRSSSLKDINPGIENYRLLAGKADFNTGNALFTSDAQHVMMIVNPNHGPQPDYIGIWSSTTGKLVDHIDLLPNSLATAFALHPGGTLAAVGLEDGRILLVDLASHQILADRQAGYSNVNAVAFSPDGRYLASSGEDGVVRIWETVQK